MEANQLLQKQELFKGANSLLTQETGEEGLWLVKITEDQKKTMKGGYGSFFCGMYCAGCGSQHLGLDRPKAE